MVKKILTLLIPILALLGGAVAGDVLRGDDPAEDAHTPVDEASAEGHEPAAGQEEPANADAHADAKDAGAAAGNGEDATGTPAVFTFPTQFFVPLARNGDMGAMMILTLALETTEEHLEALNSQEHRLRDVLLRRLLIAANTGVFDGNYTTETRLAPLRQDLLEAARSVGGDMVHGVLVEAILRQGGTN